MNEEELKQKKLEELRQKYLAQKEEEQKELDAQAQVQSMLSKVLDEGARQRLGNVRLVNKQLYTKAFQAIMMMVQKGIVREKLTEEQVKQILSKLKNDREINIQRK
ncbi:MAG: hypothetical protein NUV67_03170 [archaeon]|nr:hypothetical protein [archaeon]